jgi:penicillin-binding protein 2
MRIYEDLRDVQSRLLIVQRVVATLLLLLMGVFWHLQVNRGRHYQRLSENNRVRTVTIAAPRGRLLDRHGQALVENRPSYNVILAPERVHEVDDIVSRLGRALQMGEAPLRESLARSRSRLLPLVVKADASLADVNVVEARRLELPDVSIDVVPLRSYPLATAAAHTLGRVGEVTEAQLRSGAFEGVRPGTQVGQAGLEARYNERLMGVDGYRRVIVDAHGAEVDEADRVWPREGPSLTLTLDARLQRSAERALQGESGSVVALDPRSGEVLAISSVPAYDPNEFTAGIGREPWRTLTTDPAKPLMNRAIQGQYAPGSTFKIVVAAAALEEGVISPTTTVHCPGAASIYDTVFHCNRAGGHGYVNVRQALQHSCNVFFYRIGVKLEIDRIAKWAMRFGLGRPTGVDLPHEAAGLMPTRAWKERVLKAPWYAGETVSVAIGQGQVTATPLQLARLVAGVANGGRLVRPHLVRMVGETPLPVPPAESIGLSQATLGVIRAGLEDVVNAQGGSGWRSRLDGIRVAGKTGSAQVIGRARRPEGDEVRRELRAHGWFVAYAPAQDPEIALAVIVEHSGSGGLAAAPVARSVLMSYFSRAAEPAAAAPSRSAGDDD